MHKSTASQDRREAGNKVNVARYGPVPGVGSAAGHSGGAEVGEGEMAWKGTDGAAG